MGCCVTDELTRESARAACKTVIHDAVGTALRDDVFGVLVDALPTLGKSRTVATIATELGDFDSEETTGVTVLTHRVETRNQIEQWADSAGLDPHQLPRFDEDCPTASGEFGDGWVEKVRDLRQRGVSPGRLHASPTYNLPCSSEGTCPYVEDWEDSRDHRVLIGHPTHAYIPEVVRNRIVVFDEDPGEAFRLEFEANDIYRFVHTYLSETDELVPTSGGDWSRIESLDQLKGYREFGPEKEIDEILTTLGSETLFDDARLAGLAGGHGAARAIVLALFETEREDMGNGAERVELPDGSVAVYDEAEGRLYVRRPPDLSTAAGVVGLDGTPVLRIWEGRLGCPPSRELHYERVLCDDCRRRYLRDVLGYRIHQTSTHVKPYSSSRYVSVEKDLALIDSVYREHGVEPAVITTNAAERILEERWNHVQASAHYGNIKGSNAFAGDDVSVGVVLGSQHPGDHEIKRLAALNGDHVVFPEARLDRGKNLTYGVDSRPNEPDDPYLAHFREHQVVQAILRFGRHTGATVYVHTGAVPDWILSDGPLDSEQSVIRRSRGNGEREVIAALESNDELTAKEIEERVGIANRTVYERLDDLLEVGIVEKIEEGQPYRWRLLDADTPRRGQLVGDRWYVVLPSTVPAS